MLLIRPGEKRLVAVLFGHSFCNGLARICSDTASDSLWLTTYGTSALPYVYLGVAATAPLVGLVFSWGARRLRFPHLLGSVLGALGIAVCVLRVLLGIGAMRWPVIALAVWSYLLMILLSLEFWSLAGQLLRVEQSKRLYGLIGSGEVLATILGGLGAAAVVRQVGTLNLLLITAGGLVGVLGSLRALKPHFLQPSPPVGEHTTQEPKHGGLVTLLRKPYAMGLIATNILFLLSFYFLDYLYYDMVAVQ